jgi:hypothetical protein
MKAIDPLVFLRLKGAMLSFGMFMFVVAALLGCVWWACRDESA